jgi:hypothetical protein
VLRDRGIRDGAALAGSPPGWTRAASHVPNGNFDEAVWRLLRGSAGRLRKVSQPITERRDHLPSRTITKASTLRDARGAGGAMSRRADDANTEYSRFGTARAVRAGARWPRWRRTVSSRASSRRAIPAVLARDRRSRESSWSDWWGLARRRSLRGGGTNGRSAASEALIEVIHVHADGLTRGLKPSFTARPR